MASVNNWRKSNFVYSEVWLYGLYLVSFSYLCIGYNKGCFIYTLIYRFKFLVRIWF